MIDHAKPRPVDLELLVRRGLMRDLAERPGAATLLKSLGCLAGRPGERLTTKLFRERALDRAGAKLLSAGVRAPAVRTMLGHAQLTWNYAWRLGLVDVAPPDAPSAPAERGSHSAKPDPTPAEVAERTAEVRGRWTEKQRIKQLAAAQPGQDD